MAVIDVAASLLRGLHVTALVSLFGTLLFVLFVLPNTPATEVRRTRQLLAHLVRISAACGLVLGIAWLVTETAIIAGTDSVTSAFHAVPIVALQTQFGRWLLLRLVLLSTVLVMPRLRDITLIIAIVLAGGALGIQPMLGRAGVVMRNAGEATGPSCIASEPQVWTALAIILGLSPDALTGTQVLVDPSGWLRASWRPGDRGNWTDPAVLSAKLRDLIARPLVVRGPAPHRHSD